MTFSAKLFNYNERCDKCGEYMTAENPGIELKVRCRETGLSMVWIHIRELQKAIDKAQKEATRGAI